MSSPLVLPSTFPHWTAHGDDRSDSNAVVVDVKDVRRREDKTKEGRISETQDKISVSDSPIDDRVTEVSAVFPVRIGAWILASKIANAFK